MDPLEVVLVAFWAMLPAYVPNNAAVVFGGGAPVDGGRVWRGRRVLGDGKTWRGTIGGVGTGVVLAVCLNAIRADAAALLGAPLPQFPAAAAVALPAGAMAGDVVASFLKRRTGRARGAAFPGVDQLDFVAGALGVAAVAAPGWVARTFTVPVLIVVVLVTPALHVGTNAVAFVLGLKEEPY